MMAILSNYKDLSTAELFEEISQFANDATYRDIDDIDYNLQMINEIVDMIHQRYMENIEYEKSR